MPPGMFLIFWRGWANWVVQTCLQGMFLIFLKGWGLDFPSSSPQTVPIKFFLFLSIFHQNPFVLIKFPNNSRQIPFVPMSMEIGRWAQVSTKVNGDTRERLGRSAKRSAAVRGQDGRGATVAASRLSGATEHKVGIFCLRVFVEDRGQICFSLGSLPRFFFMCPKSLKLRWRTTHKGYHQQRMERLK
jgi:hypothetical protein